MTSFWVFGSGRDFLRDLTFLFYPFHVSYTILGDGGWAGGLIGRTRVYPVVRGQTFT